MRSLTDLCYDEMDSRYTARYMANMQWSIGGMVYAYIHQGKGGSFPVEAYEPPAEKILHEHRNRDERSGDELRKQVLRGLS